MYVFCYGFLYHIRKVIHKQWKFNFLAKRIFYKLIHYLWIKLCKV